MTPSFSGGQGGEHRYDLEAREVWVWRVTGPPRFAVQQGGYSHAVMTGLSRKAAAKLAALLLRSPACNEVRLVELAREGVWERSPEQERAAFGLPPKGEAP